MQSISAATSDYPQNTSAVVVPIINSPAAAASDGRSNRNALGVPVNSQGVSLLINNGEPVSPEDLSHLDFFDKQISTQGRGPFVRAPLGKMWAPCGEEACKIPMYAPWSWCCVGGAVSVTGTFFIVWVAPEAEIWSRVIVGVFMVALLALIFLGGCSDPGIVLPARTDSPAVQEQVIEIIGVGKVTLDVCKTCRVLRPPRSSHCSLQGVCVDNYDHYCGVTGTLVAERTFRYFTLQLIGYVLYAAFIAIRCIVLVVTDGDKLASEGRGGVWRAVCTYILLVIGCLIACCVSGIAGHYIELSCKGRTLKDERGRKKFLPDEEGYSCIRCVQRLCGAMVPSRLFNGMEYVGGHDV